MKPSQKKLLTFEDRIAHRDSDAWKFFYLSCVEELCRKLDSAYVLDHGDYCFLKPISQCPYCRAVTTYKIKYKFKADIPRLKKGVATGPRSEWRKLFNTLNPHRDETETISNAAFPLDSSVCRDRRCRAIDKFYGNLLGAWKEDFLAKIILKVIKHEGNNEDKRRLEKHFVRHTGRISEWKDRYCFRKDRDTISG